MHHHPHTEGRITHLLFAVALGTLVVLGLRWFALHYEQVRTIHAEFVENRRATAELRALRLGLQLHPPSEGRDGAFEVLPADRLSPDDTGFRLQPNWPRLALRLSPEARDEETARLKRRELMVLGEGSLLVLLILVCVLMLYRLLLIEHRGAREKETFFRAVGHELKTPVAGLRALLETLAAKPLSPTELKHYANLGLRQTSRLQTLIENVLLSNRIGRKLFEVSLREVKLVGEVRRLIEQRNHLFAAQPVAFHVEMEEDQRALVDPDLLRVVLENLVDNAFKYSPEPASVSVNLRREGQWCIIAVADQGIGLSAAEREQVFRKFYRADNPAVQAAKGTGLGLFIAREIARAQGGSIEAFSAGPGLGSRFEVRVLSVE